MSTPEKKPDYSLLWLLVLLAPFAFLLSYCSSRSPAPLPQEVITRDACQRAGKAIATYPDTAEFAWGQLSSEDRRWESTMTSRNAYNVPVTNSFVCWVEANGAVSSFTLRN